MSLQFFPKSGQVGPRSWQFRGELVTTGHEPTSQRRREVVLLPPWLLLRLPRSFCTTRKAGLGVESRGVDDGWGETKIERALSRRSFALSKKKTIPVTCGNLNENLTLLSNYVGTGTMVTTVNCRINKFSELCDESYSWLLFSNQPKISSSSLGSSSPHSMKQLWNCDTGRST